MWITKYMGEKIILSVFQRYRYNLYTFINWNSYPNYSFILIPKITS